MTLKEVTLLTTENDVLDFINYIIKEPQVRQDILRILSMDPTKDSTLCIKIPYDEEPFCMLLKWEARAPHSGLLLVTSKDWRIIINLLRDMLKEANQKERQFLFPIIESAESQFKILEKL